MSALGFVNDPAGIRCCCVREYRTPREGTAYYHEEMYIITVYKTTDLKKSICLFLNPIVQLLLFCLYMQQYFNFIVAVSFIGGGNQSTQRKPPTCRNSLSNFIT
jgi:hypothetical protein